jgi:DNA-binding transcriptional regulator YiaG
VHDLEIGATPAARIACTVLRTRKTPGAIAIRTALRVPELRDRPPSTSPCQDGARDRAIRLTPVKKIRKKLGLSQTEFASRFGIAPGTLRDWEQERKRPEGPARVLLMVIDREPDAVRRALERA